MRNNSFFTPSKSKEPIVHPSLLLLNCLCLPYKIYQMSIFNTQKTAILHLLLFTSNKKPIQKPSFLNLFSIFIGPLPCSTE